MTETGEVRANTTRPERWIVVLAFLAMLLILGTVFVGMPLYKRARIALYGLEPHFFARYEPYPPGVTLKAEKRTHMQGQRTDLVVGWRVGVFSTRDLSQAGEFCRHIENTNSEVKPSNILKCAVGTLWQEVEVLKNDGSYRPKQFLPLWRWLEDNVSSENDVVVVIMAL